MIRLAALKLEQAMAGWLPRLEPNLAPHFAAVGIVARSVSCPSQAPPAFHCRYQSLVWSS